MRHGCRLLPSTFRKLPLGVWCAIGVVQAFEVAGHDGRQSDRANEANHVHRHARLVAIGVGIDNALPYRLCLEDRANSRVELHIHQHDMLAVLDGRKHRARPRLHGAGALDNEVDVVGGTQHRRILGDAGLAAPDGVVEFRCPADRADIGRASVRQRGMRRRDGAVCDCHDPQSRYGPHDLIGDTPAAVASPGDRYANRVAFCDTLCKRSVNDDHDAVPTLLLNSGHAAS